MSQDAIIRALGEPSFYPHHPSRVEHVQTHISHIFLAGPYAYKLKKAVSLPFLDFGSVEMRYHYCAEEIRLNGRLCPEVYLDVLSLTRTPAGGLALGGAGEVIDHVVWMRRLPAERMLASLISTGGVRVEMVVQLAAMLAAFHAVAPSGPEVSVHADPGALLARWQENMQTSASAVGLLLTAEDYEILADFGPSFIRRHQTLLCTRQQGGRIREGHGDLHADNICFVDAPVPASGDLAPLAPGIYVFDCLEFSQPFRCNDVASEIAFLAMDLVSLDRPDLANAFVAAYTEAAADPTVDVLLPFYACYRACVRGKVESLKSAEPEVELVDREAAAARGRRHFALALRYAWQAGGPAAVACVGLSGTGKTTLAEEIASTTGFVLIASDVLRKRRAGLALETAALAPPGGGLYTRAARAATYQALCAEAEAALAAGKGVIADATFIRADDRRRLATVARGQRCPWLFVECRADEGVIRARLGERTPGSSVSDARWETYLAQRREREEFGADEPHIVVDTSSGLAPARALALRHIWQWRQGRPAGLA